MDFFLGCPEKVQVSFLIPIPITRYLLFTQHCVGSEKSNPERIHKWTSFNRIRRWKFRLEYSKLMFFNFFFRESFLKSRRVTWMIQSILPFFLLMLEEEKKKKKKKTQTRELFEREFYWEIKATFCMRFMPLPIISWGTSSNFPKKVDNRISSLLLKNRKMFFHPRSLMFNIYINKIYWIFVWHIKIYWNVLLTF